MTEERKKELEAALQRSKYAAGYVEADPPLSALQINPASSAVAPWRPDLTTRVREVMEGEGLTERYVDVLLRGATDPFDLIDWASNRVELLQTWECRTHPDFLTHEREEWEFHLRDYHPRQWAQRQIDLNQE